MKVVKKDEPQVTSAKSGKGKAVLSTIALIAAFMMSLLFIISFAAPRRMNEPRAISEAYTSIESEGGTYYGPATGMEYYGTGEFHYLSGGVYEGSFSNSERKGEGTFTWDNGDSYTGTWENDQMKEGTYTWANGDSFNGTWENNNMAKGKYFFADVGTFTGTIANGILSSGTITLNVSEDASYSSYIIEYEDGKVSNSNIVFKDGTKLSGLINGKAEITYPNGDTYTGTVENGVRNGNGTYTWYNASKAEIAKYVGEWKDGAMHGVGAYFYTSDAYPKLSGSFENGKPKGTLIYYKEAANTFDTVWSNGKCTKVTET